MEWKNLVNRTIVNYVLVAVGSFLASKGLIPIDLWDLVRGGLEEAILVAVGGGGLIAIIVGAARGISESKKDKIVVDGERVVIPPTDKGVTRNEFETIESAIKKIGDRFLPPR